MKVRRSRGDGWRRHDGGRLSSLGNQRTWSQAWAALVPAVVLVCTHLWVGFRQPKAYMDELFHVPQAQQFCESFRRGSTPSYDRSITTPPGPYIVPVVFSTIHPFFCTTSGLRSLSAAFTLMLVFQINTILNSLRSRRPCSVADVVPSQGDCSHSILESVVVLFHPPLFFYSNLFYTDPPAIFLLLVSFRFALEKRHVISAVLGFCSSLCRQTSSIFHAFVVFDTMVFAYVKGDSLCELFCAVIPHGVAGLLYLLLFRANGYKVPIGDTSNHPISIHHAMFGYHAGYCALFGFPLLIACGLARRSRFRTGLVAVQRQLKSATWRFLFLLLVVAFALLVAATGDFVHPFAIADNRHYVFYVYRRILLRSALLRFSLVPLYAGVLFAQFSHIDAVRQFADTAAGKDRYPREESVALRDWHLGEVLTEAALLLSIALCVVPSTLLEPRYFVPGFLLIALRALARTPMRLPDAYIAGSLLLLANIGLVYVFCELPFLRPVDAHMPSDTSLGRFMF